MFLKIEIFEYNSIYAYYKWYYMEIIESFVVDFRDIFIVIKS